MLRFTHILFFLAVAILSIVVAAPAPAAAAADPISLRQATRAGIVDRRRFSAVRRQEPSSVPFLPRTFRIRVPTTSSETAIAGRYLVNTAIPPAAGVRGFTTAFRGTSTGATIYQLSSTGLLQPSDDLTLLAAVDANTISSSGIIFVPPSDLPRVGAGGIALACSIGANLVLACTDAAQSDRAVGVNTALFGDLPFYTPNPVSSVVVEYL